MSSAMLPTSGAVPLPPRAGTSVKEMLSGAWRKCSLNRWGAKFYVFVVFRKLTPMNLVKVFHGQVVRQFDVATPFLIRIYQLKHQGLFSDR